MTRSMFILAGVLAVSITATSASAQSQPATNVRVEAPATERLDEAVSFFLFEALRARGRLREQGLQSRADRFWGAAGEFVTIVRDADADDAPMFLPILDGFRRTLAETMVQDANLDSEKLAGIQAALDDQISIHTSPGAFPDAKGLINIEVRALRNGKAVNNLYVSLDLVGVVPKGKSANELSQVTSPARGAVGPGRYLVRLRSLAGQVGDRDVQIGKSGREQVIDVLVQ